MLRQKLEGEIKRIAPDPYDPGSFVWLDVLAGQQMLRLMVTQRFAQEKGLLEGEKFSWETWTIPILNILLLNPVLDITSEFKD